MTPSRLVTLLGTTVRQQRESRELSQRQLADLAGVSQAAVARIERGDRAPRLPVLERLLTAMDVQLAVTVEPLDAHLDARIHELAARPLADRVDDAGISLITERLGDLPYVLTGASAALLQGAPVPVEGVDVAIRWADSDRLAHWLAGAYGQRWSTRWQEFGYLPLSPQEPGEHRWQTRYGEIRAQMCDELPEAIEVRHDERSYRVVPLVQVELDDPRAAGLLRRYRSRSGAGPADRPGDDPSASSAS